MSANKQLTDVITSLKEKYGNSATKEQVEEWFSQHGYTAVDVDKRYPDEPAKKFVKEGNPLVYRVGSTIMVYDHQHIDGCMVGPEFAVLIASGDGFHAHYPLNNMDRLCQ